MTHEVMVDYRTICGDKIIIPAGNVNEDVIAATFSDEWTENLTKAVIFERGGRVFQTTLADGVFAIPAKLAATAGRFRWGFVGYEIDGDTVTERISTAPVYGMITDGAYDDGAPDDVEPAEWEALIAHLTDFQNPHRVTAEQIGAATTERAGRIEARVDEIGLGLSVLSEAVEEMAPKVGQIDELSESVSAVVLGLHDTAEALDAHKADKENPHAVTAEQIGAATAKEIADVKTSLTAVEARANAAMPKTGGKFTGPIWVPGTVYVDASNYYLTWAENAPIIAGKIANFNGGATALPATFENSALYRGYAQAAVEAGKTYVVVATIKINALTAGKVSVARLISYTDRADGFDELGVMPIEEALPSGWQVGGTYVMCYTRQVLASEHITHIGIAFKNEVESTPSCSITVLGLTAFPAANVTTELTAHAVVTTYNAWNDANNLFSNGKTNAVTSDGLICGRPGTGATFEAITQGSVVVGTKLAELERRIAALEEEN